VKRRIKGWIRAANLTQVNDNPEFFLYGGDEIVERSLSHDTTDELKNEHEAIK